MKLKQILEAKYASGQVDIKTANAMYQDAYDANDYNEAKIKMSRPSMGGTGEFQYIDVEVMIPNIKNKEEAIKAATWFADEFNIPYTNISKTAPYESSAQWGRLYGYWVATIAYYPFGKPSYLHR